MRMDAVMEQNRLNKIKEDELEKAAKLKSIIMIIFYNF